MPQPQPRQQPRLNDIQMLQRQIMLKQLQEFGRHQQLQELGDGRQHNYLNQLSATNKQASGGQFSPVINGTPIHDASQMLMAGNMTLMQHGALPAVQGFPNGLYSQAQSQDLHSMGLASQPHDVSLYGTPIASSRNNYHQYSHSQGLSLHSANVLTSDNQKEKLTMQSSDFGNSFLGENSNFPPDQLSVTDGASLSKQFFHGKKLLGQVPIQGFNTGMLPENFQQVHALESNASAEEFNRRQEQAGWPENFSGGTTQMDPSRGLTALDPLEQKILFNLDDDSSWNASFGRKADMGTGGFGDSLVYADHASSFPSIQSGSWSALMQSAVGEASSSDTGLQEEWSGLSFQNTDPLTDNQQSNFLDSGNQHTGWVHNTVQSASSLNCKPQLLFNDTNMSSEFPGFQPSGIQFSTDHREGMRSDSSHESVQQSPKTAAKWLDCNSQQNQPTEESHTIQPLENTWPFQRMHLEGNEQQQNISSYYNSHQPDNKLLGSKIESPSPSGNATMSSRDNEKHQNYHQRENSNDSYHSNASQRNITEDEARENMWLHASDSRSVARGNQKSSVQGRLPDNQRNSNASEEVSPRGNIGANVSASFDRSVGIYGSNLTSHTRQDMLELLHKVDYTREQRAVTHLSSTDSSPMLELPEAETTEASMAKSYYQSSGSQRFGLRLAPPSQQLPNSNSSFSLQSPSQSGNSAATSPSSLYRRNQLQGPRMPAAPVAIHSPETTLQFNNATSQGTSQPVSINFGHQFPFLGAVPVSHPSLTSDLSQQVGSSGPHSVWTNLPNQPHPAGTEPSKLRSDLLMSADSTITNLSEGFDYGEEHREKKRAQQQIPSETVDQASHAGRLLHGQESVAKHISEANAIGRGSLMAQHHQQNFDSARHADKQTPAVSARDLEAFGRHLKPSSLHHNYSLLHQVRALNNVKTDPSRLVSEKNHGAGSDLNLQQVTSIAGHQLMYGQNSGVKDPMNSRLNVASRLNSFPNRDVKMLSFSSETGDDQPINASSLPVLQDTPREMATHGQSYSQSDSSCNNMAINRTEHSQISLQMAPSWFKHHGTLKNGQILPMYDARTAMNSAQQFPLGNPFENSHMNTSTVQVNAAGATQFSGLQSPTAATLAVGKLTPPRVLPPDVIDWNLSVLRSKKRKFVKSELLPWHKEITQSSKRLQTISVAELEWAQAANRFTEKVEDEAVTVEEAHPLLRLKKRLVLTTQLMQQVFRPPPPAILSANSTSNYDCMAYFAAKLALGDACNLTSCLRSDSCMMSENLKTPERIGEEYFSKVVEDFISRAKKLESDLFRLDKKASIADVRVEYQELEKFSLMNRFVKFHSRGQQDAAETSSSTGGIPKSFPQRYVTAFPMPTALPEGAQCISL